jgi:hypothetical protein
MADIVIEIKHQEEIVLPPMPLPDALTAILSGQSTSILRVGWSDPGILAEYYEIQYGTSPTFAAFTTISNIAVTPGAGGFVDITGLSLLTSDYYVRIKAVNSGGSSAWDYATFNIPTPDLLTNLVLTAIAGPAIKVEFDDPGMFAVQYDIDVSTLVGFGTYTRTTIASNPEAHTIQNISAGIAAATTYFVRVRPKNGAITNLFIDGTVTT